MMILRKIIHCKSLENYQENIYGGFFFSKFASLQCKGWNSDINGLHHSPFWNMFRKLAALRIKF